MIYRRLTGCLQGDLSNADVSKLLEIEKHLTSEFELILHKNKFWLDPEGYELLQHYVESVQYFEFIKEINSHDTVKRLKKKEEEKIIAKQMETYRKKFLLIE